MRILIDECLPKKLKRELVDYIVLMVQEKGWSSMKNSELLRVAENEFDVLVTADQNIEYQQNLSLFNIAVVVLVAHNNRLETLQPLMSKLHEVLKTIQPHEVIHIVA